jgi:energy-coupling factor transporter ATP-binding protein EcfA2
VRRSLREAQSEAGLIFVTHDLSKVFQHSPKVVFHTTQRRPDAIEFDLANLNRIHNRLSAISNGDDR